MKPIRSFAATFARLDPLTFIGFLVPIAVAVLAGLIIHAHSQPIAAPVVQTTTPSGRVTATTPADPPTATEVAAANQAILDYCRNDLRKDTGCELVPNSNVTAPGFVESGLKMTGSFATDGSGSQGLALAKGSGSSWAVVWVGQSCIPKDVASQNAIPATLTICQ